TKRKDYVDAEKFFRDALQHYSDTLPPSHLNVGITKIRLGNALIGQRRYADAEVQSLAGYQIVVKQTKSPVHWLKMAREDLATEYDALKQPAKAAEFRAAASGTLDKNSIVAVKN